MAEELKLKTGFSASTVSRLLFHNPTLHVEAAIRHYRQNLLRKYGMRPWLHVLHNNSDVARAVQQHQRSLIMHAFSAWNQAFERNILQKTQLATQQHRQYRLKKIIEAWRQVRNENPLLVIDYAWQLQLGAEEHAVSVHAKRHDQRRLMRNALAMWRYGRRIHCD